MMMVVNRAARIKYENETKKKKKTTKYATEKVCGEKKVNDRITKCLTRVVYATVLLKRAVAKE